MGDSKFCVGRYVNKRSKQLIRQKQWNWNDFKFMWKHPMSFNGLDTAGVDWVHRFISYSKKNYLVKNEFGWFRILNLVLSTSKNEWHIPIKSNNDQNNPFRAISTELNFRFT